MVGALLSAEGHQIIDAGSGAQGIARAEEDDPDVVLLDLMMPGEMDGMATLQRLKETQADLPVIMMSGRAGLSDAVIFSILFLVLLLRPNGLFGTLRRDSRVARA